MLEITQEQYSRLLILGTLIEHYDNILWETDYSVV
jgi:hypothetical protein